ncbi:PAS domain-containing sensor histidine kinase [Microcoleus sp. FACHB-68]|uniref:PAS domain-containing sensor histidine kinase n=1 Tax=Microcoleus sp. FACHB-68 TaxID=2692826 RepID=UPI0016887A4C|nr:PAS domain-containing sensor histidine kinase [Microcoleus sp. FACHB-68]MBD1937991.1 PAS domain S-box protein [Microcoleus sp. FACHB-68]
MKNTLNGGRPSKPRLTPLRITAIYVMIGSLWIWFSDEILLSLIPHAGILSKLQTFKGWFYVTITASILYWLIHQLMRATQQSEMALRQANETLRATQSSLKENLSELQAIQEELQTSEERYRLISELTSDYAYTLSVASDGQFTIEWLTEAFSRSSGYPLAEVTGPQGWEKLIHPDDLLLVKVRNRNLLSGQPSTQDFRIITKHAEVRWLRDYARPEWDATHQRVIRIFGAAQDITQYKQAEAALRESEVKFRIISEASPIPIIISRASDGVILYANEQLSLMLGLGTEQFIGRRAPDFYDNPADREALLELVKKDEVVYNYEVRAKKANGSRFWIVVSLQLLIFNGEQALLSTIYDITERKQMEEALRESERRYRLLFETNPQPMWVYDVETLAFVAVNSAATQHYGYSEDEFLAMTIRDIRPPEDIPALIEDLSKLPTGLRAAGRWRHCKKDGTIIEVEITAHSLTFAGRRTQLVLANDVTERQRAERALRASEEQYRELVNNLHEIIFQQDRRGIWTFLNPAWSEVMGYTLAETLGTDFLNYVHPDDRHYSQTQLHCLLNFEIDDCRYEVRFLAQDGSIRTLAVFARRLISSSGEVAGATGTLMDITERKAAETRLQTLNAELERQVEERTAQLQTQMQELRQLNELKDDFLSTVSHELRTPMTNMKMAISMLQLAIKSTQERGLEKEDAFAQFYQKFQRYLQILENECEREISLINDLLDLQRLEMSPAVPTWETICLQEWLPQVVVPFQARLRNRQQILHLHIDPDVLPLHSHLASWERIVAELLNNACKYTPPGGEIGVRLQQASGSSGGADSSSLATNVTQLIVSNSGSQIPVEELSRIFDKFYRVASSDPWKQGGTGLGLALVKQLVQQLGGRIWAESESNRTWFTVELPTDTEAVYKISA